MTYTFQTDIDKDEYMGFVETLSHYNITQTPMWAQVKTGWTHTLCALYEDGTVVAAAMLLQRKLAPGLKIIYSPRGFLLDYQNEAHLREFTAGVYAYAKKQGAYLVRIDPEIVLSTACKGTISENPAGKAALAALQAQGYLHMGFARDFHSYTQPRFNAEYPLVDGTAPVADDVILAGFDKKLKKFIGRYTEERGIFFEAKTGPAYAAEFSAISEHTEQRQHILLRDLQYFQRLSEAFGEDCVFFFAKMDLEKFLQFCEKQPQSEQVQKDTQQAKALLQQTKTVTLSALLTVKSKDTAYLLYSGFDDSVYPRFRTTNQIRFEAMKYFRDHGCKTFSFVGINGNLDDSLSQFKLKFNPQIVEFIGECELPVKKMTYRIMRRAFPVFKRIYMKIMLRKKEKKSL